MAQTETETGVSGFPGPPTRARRGRRPWNGRHHDRTRRAPTAIPPHDANQEPVDDAPTASDRRADDTRPAPAATTKLMADLSRAMQTAAEGARDETVARFLAEFEDRGRGDPGERRRSRRRTSDAGPTTTSPSSATGPRPRSRESAKRPRHGSPHASRRSTARSTRMPPSSRRASSASARRSRHSRPRWTSSSSASWPSRTRPASPRWPRRCPSRPTSRGSPRPITEADPAPADPVETLVPERRRGTRAGRAGRTAEPAAEAVTPTAGRRRGRSGDGCPTRFRCGRGRGGDLHGRARHRGSRRSGRPRQRPAAESARVEHRAEHHHRSGQRRRRQLSIPAAAARTTTSVVVTGLVSVASIATFKRGLTRSAGVSAVASRVRTRRRVHLHGRPRRGASGWPTRSWRCEGFEVADHRRDRRRRLEVTAHDPDPGD